MFVTASPISTVGFGKLVLNCTERSGMGGFTYMGLSTAPFSNPYGAPVVAMAYVMQPGPVALDLTAYQGNYHVFFYAEGNGVASPSTRSASADLITIQ